MSLANLHHALRAAVRERLLTCVDISHAPGVSVTLANGVFTRISGSWLTAGFAAGQEVTASGFPGGTKVGVVKSVSALALTTDIEGSGTVAGGGTFVVALPSDRAWEGFTFLATSGKPYVAESFRPGPSRLRSIANANGAGNTIEHVIEASLTLFYPTERGTLALDRMAGALMAHFRPGQSLARDDVKAVISNVEASPVYPDGAWIARAVTASLLAFTQS